MINKIYEKIKEFMKENYKGILIVIIVFLLFNIELPYSIYSPGGAVNLNERIEVNDSYKETGSFNMAYVSMVKGTIPFILISKIIPDWDIVKKEDLTIEGESISEMVERERLYLEQSIGSATINAYQEANKDIKITNINNKVSYIAKEAKTDLKIGDNILKVNDIKISSLKELKDIVSKLPANSKVNLSVKRNNKELNVNALTYQAENETRIGISIITTYEYETTPNIKIKSKASEMGSSGGLMMSLTIYNKLTSNDITKGKKIVGTGTIDINGNIGEIGGVKYKLIGAVKKKAEIFICPKENEAEALQVAKEKNYKIKIISAETFKEVLEKLENLD